MMHCLTSVGTKKSLIGIGTVIKKFNGYGASAQFGNAESAARTQKFSLGLRQWKENGATISSGNWTFHSFADLSVVFGTNM